LVIVAAGALLWTIYQRPPQQTSGGTRFESVKDLSLRPNTITKRIGTGTLALIEFSDFQCPYCGQFARETYPAVHKEFVNTGKLTFLSFAFPLEGVHPLARKASEAAECAARQGKYWQTREFIFAHQALLNSAGLSDAPAFLGLNRDGFEACIANEAVAAVQADIDQGRKLGVSSTPTLFLGRFRTDGSIELIKRVRGTARFADLKPLILEGLGKGSQWGLRGRFVLAGLRSRDPVASKEHL